MKRAPDLVIAPGPNIQGVSPAGKAFLADKATVVDLYEQAGGLELHWAWLVWGAARGDYGLSVLVQDPLVEAYIDEKLSIYD